MSPRTIAVLTVAGSVLLVAGGAAALFALDLYRIEHAQDGDR